MSGLTDPAIIVSLVAGAGIGAQLLAYRLKIPAILPLLLLGFLAGPLTGLFDPDLVFGDLLFPAVSLGVALILFEGALTLHFDDIRGAERVVIRLITVGVVVTVAVLATASHILFDFPWMLAILFGAICSVSGPTVVVPLLRAMRPSDKVAQILRWEGILIDPIGAVLAVIVFQLMIAGASGDEGGGIFSFFITLLSGAAIGCGAGWLIGQALKRHLIPDYLKNVAVLAVVLLAFTGANLVAHEGGLVAVTAMGMVIANMKGTQTEAILDFKESLSVLLISMLFIVLAARVDLEALVALGGMLAILLAVVLFVARPLATLASTLGTSTNWRERILLSWIAPRGIVAAAISALFALRLEANGFERAAEIVPLTFSVIVATVVLQSLTARPFARLLNLAEPENRGVLLVGGNPVALTIAEALKNNGVKVIVADTSWSHISGARMLGLNTFFGNAVSEQADRALDLVGIGKLMALSRMPALNALAALRYRGEFGTANVFTIRNNPGGANKEAAPAAEGYRGNLLFKPEMTLEHLAAEFSSGKQIRVTEISADFGFDALVEEVGGTAPLLFAITPEGFVRPFSEEAPFRASAGWKIGYIAARKDASDKPKDGQA